MAETRKVPFVWNIEAIHDRGPIDEPILISAACGATMSDSVGSYGELLLENSALAYVAEQIGADPQDLVVVSFHWSMLDDSQTTTPPPR